MRRLGVPNHVCITFASRVLFNYAPVRESGIRLIFLTSQFSTVSVGRLMTLSQLVIIILVTTLLCDSTRRRFHGGLSEVLKLWELPGGVRARVRHVSSRAVNFSVAAT